MILANQNTRLPQKQGILYSNRNCAPLLSFKHFFMNFAHHRILKNALQLWVVMVTSSCYVKIDVRTYADVKLLIAWSWQKKFKPKNNFNVELRVGISFLLTVDMICQKRKDRKVTIETSKSVFEFNILQASGKRTVCEKRWCFQSKEGFSMDFLIIVHWISCKFWW